VHNILLNSVLLSLIVTGGVRPKLPGQTPLDYTPPPLFSSVCESVGVRTPSRGSDRVRSTRQCQFSTKIPAGFFPTMSYGSRKRSYDQGVRVRGVDLRITSSPSQTLCRRLVRTTNDGRRRECSARRRPSRLYFSHFSTRTVYNTVNLYAVYAAIFVQNRVFCLPHLHSTPPLGEFPSKYCHPVWHGKTRMAWLPMVKQF